MNSSMSWQVMSFVLVFDLALIFLVVSACLRVRESLRKNLLIIGLSALGGSFAGIFGAHYLSHYFPSLMLSLGVAGLIAERLMAWFDGKSSSEQKQ